MSFEEARSQPPPLLVAGAPASAPSLRPAVAVARPAACRITARTVEIVARSAVAVATAWFVLALCWGINAWIGNGHDSVVASRGIIAENMVRWHIWGPVRQYTLTQPDPHLYYAHHPWGSFWVLGLFAKVLGRHAFVPRLVAVLMSAAVPPLLYGIGRVLWGPVAGAAAAVLYTALPITLAFGNFPGFEGPLALGCLIATWGYLRFQEKWRARWMWVSLFGVLFGVNADWEANVFFAVVLAGLITAHLFLPSRWFGRVDTRRFMRWWALCVIIACATLVGYAAYVVHVGAVEDLLKQAARRSSGNGMPIGAVLDSRAYWLDLMFTPLALRVALVGLWVFVVRVLVLRRTLEIFPLAFCAMAAVQYFLFKNGADVHIYWPMPLAPFCALSLGVITDVLIAGGWRLMRRLRRSDARYTTELAAFACSACVPLLILPDGVIGLHYARMTGGRFNDKGKQIFREVDKAQALDWMGSRIDHRSTVLIHAGMHSTWAQDWALHNVLQASSEIPAGHVSNEARYFVADLQFMSPADQQKLASTYHVTAVGPYVLVDRSVPQAPADGYSFVEREPNLLEWYFTSGVDPVRTIRADPFRTWELREHFGQRPNPAPSEQPQTLEELRVAHNIAVAAGDQELAATYRTRIAEQLRTSVETPFTDGTRLLGERYVSGVAPTLSLYFLSQGPSAMDLEFQIDSYVQNKAALSLVPMDRVVRQVGSPFVPSPRLWKKGFIYVVRTEIRQRPGEEKFAGYFQSADRADIPRPNTGAPSVELLDLP